MTSFFPETERDFTDRFVLHKNKDGLCVLDLDTDLFAAYVHPVGVAFKLTDSRGQLIAVLKNVDGAIPVLEAFYAFRRKIHHLEVPHHERLAILANAPENDGA